MHGDLLGLHLGGLSLAGDFLTVPCTETLQPVVSFLISLS